MGSGGEGRGEGEVGEGRGGVRLGNGRVRNVSGWWVGLYMPTKMFAREGRRMIMDYPYRHVGSLRTFIYMLVWLDLGSPCAVAIDRWLKPNP